MIYLYLSNGKEDPEEGGWGSNDIILGPFLQITISYGKNIQLDDDHNHSFDFEFTEHRCIHYDGVYYGEVDILSLEGLNDLGYRREEVDEFDPDLLKL